MVYFYNVGVIYHLFIVIIVVNYYYNCYHYINIINSIVIIIIIIILLSSLSFLHLLSLYYKSYWNNYQNQQNYHYHAYNNFYCQRSKQLCTYMYGYFFRLSFYGCVGNAHPLVTPAEEESVEAGEAHDADGQPVLDFCTIEEIKNKQ